MARTTLAALILIAACPGSGFARGEAHYVDARTGDDARSGSSPDQAWRSLRRVNEAKLGPGDRVRLEAGGVWQGQLLIRSQGKPGHPIVIEAHGEGARPRIEGEGKVEDAVRLENVQHLALRGLEITNHGPADANAIRRGVHLVGDNAGTLSEIEITDLFVHDVNGTQKRKENGGIIFTTRGRTPTRFDGLRIERNIVWKVDRSGIVAQSAFASRTNWFPSLRVVIRDNWLGDVGGDGITPWATDGCLIEHNILVGANERAGSYNAGIWPWSTDNTTMRLNRASGVKTTLDGQGFDSDYNSRNTRIEYNLSHDNEGGFLLICTPGKRDPRGNLGNLGTVARHNISRNDGARTFHVSAAEDTLVEANAIYTAPGAEVQVLLLSDWDGWARGLVLRDNLFVSEGLARYGHQVRRDKDGKYGVEPGWGPARDVEFRGNRYVGRHEGRPEGEAAPERAPSPIAFDDWPGPQFDPHEPQRFGAYLDAHRRWLIALMEKQFGLKPSAHDLAHPDESR